MPQKPDFQFNFEHLSKRKQEAELRLQQLNLHEVPIQDTKDVPALLAQPDLSSVIIQTRLKEILRCYDYSEDEIITQLTNPEVAFRIAISLITQDYFLYSFFKGNGEVNYDLMYLGDKEDFNPEDYVFDLEANYSDFNQINPFNKPQVEVADTSGIPKYVIGSEGETSKIYPTKKIDDILPGTIGYDILILQGRVNITPDGDINIYKPQIMIIGRPLKGDPVSVFIKRS